MYYFFFSCNIDKTQNLLPKLSEIPGVTVHLIDADTSFTSYYEMYFSQPVDHNNPDGRKFKQRVLLGLRSVDRPMVVELQGYNIWTPKAGELSRLLNANQLTIEHRFFKDSNLDSIPYKYLNIEQAAADQHKVIQSLKSLFKNKWISTGISKGGQTTIYHRYFYPNDVDISVPYVAPMNLAREDSRIHNHLNTIGTDECRAKIKEFQFSLFEKRKELLPLLKKYCEEKKLSFPITYEKLLDIDILEYPFSFWQWGHQQNNIPNKNASLNDLFNHLVSVSSPSFFSNEGIEKEQAFFYQALTEIGLYSYQIADFTDYISYKEDLTFDFTLPANVSHEFNGEAMIKVNNWLQTDAQKIMFIGGEYDTWNSTSVNLKGNNKCVKFTNPKGCHSTRIHSFPEDMKKDIIAVLEKWLEMKI